MRAAFRVHPAMVPQWTRRTPKLWPRPHMTPGPHIVRRIQRVLERVCQTTPAEPATTSLSNEHMPSSTWPYAHTAPSHGAPTQHGQGTTESTHTTNVLVGTMVVKGSGGRVPTVPCLGNRRTTHTRVHRTCKALQQTGTQHPTTNQTIRKRHKAMDSQDHPNPIG